MGVGDLNSDPHACTADAYPLYCPLNPGNRFLNIRGMLTVINNIWHVGSAQLVFTISNSKNPGEPRGKDSGPKSHRCNALWNQSVFFPFTTRKFILFCFGDQAWPATQDCRLLSYVPGWKPHCVSGPSAFIMETSSPGLCSDRERTGWRSGLGRPAMRGAAEHYSWSIECVSGRQQYLIFLRNWPKVYKLKIRKSEWLWGIKAWSIILWDRARAWCH